MPENFLEKGFLVLGQFVYLLGGKMAKKTDVHTHRQLGSGAVKHFLFELLFLSLFYYLCYGMALIVTY